ncbi:MAG: haloacid dehalogenase, partial [Solirubrobacterales bacterium]|nr:haloacid dehalogenase [Solirubrobacterales bacterium]
CLKRKVPVVWVNRGKETLESNQKKPDAEAKDLREAMKILGIS